MAVASKLKHCGVNFRTYGNFDVVSPENLSIGDNVSINNGVYINARGGIVIGNNVALSAGAKIISTSLQASSLSSKEHVDAPVVIGSAVQIGAGAIILPGVIIGNNTIIGAGAVMTRNADSNSIYAGAPGRKIRQL